MMLSPIKPKTLCKADAMGVPAWVARLFGTDWVSLHAVRTPDRIVVSSDGVWALARVVIEDADDLADHDLREATARAYRSVLQRLTADAAYVPVRVWNAVPSITRPNTSGQHRYMAFNAGRHEAYAAHFTPRDDLPRAMPTASAIGHDGKALAICVLAHHKPGRGIENPRQVPAYRYSRRYGQTPPSFVRATVLPTPLQDTAEACLLVAGTASVVGEDSLHPGDLSAQLKETYRNMAAIAAALSGPEPGTTALPEDTLAEWLGRYRSARVYVRAPGDFKQVMQSVSMTLPNANEIELVRADICRPELLVEIEGVAAIPHIQAVQHA